MSIIMLIVGGNIVDTIIIGDGSSFRVAISVASMKRNGIMSIVIIIVGVI
jgi:hypothetical protein